MTEEFGWMTVLMIWMESPLALCLPAISWYIMETAPLRVVDLYSLYMLTTSVLVEYLRTIPKFLMEPVFFSKISETETISPWHFLTLFCLFISYQKWDLARTTFLAKTLILKQVGSGVASLGSSLPTTQNCLTYTSKIKMINTNS